MSRPQSGEVLIIRWSFAFTIHTLAAAELVRGLLAEQAFRKLFLYVNNRLEGNALLTIMAILEALA